MKDVYMLKSVLKSYTESYKYSFIRKDMNIFDIHLTTFRTRKVEKYSQIHEYMLVYISKNF